MQSTIKYQCLDNEVAIEIEIKDGRIVNLWLNSDHRKKWLGITIDDLEAAISLVKDEIKQQEADEMKLS